MRIYLFSDIPGLLVLSVVILISGCSDRKKQQAADSVEEKQKTTQKKPSAPASLPPNSANVTGLVKTVQKSTDGQLLVDFQIDRIGGYGSSTRPLNPKQKLQLTTTPSFLTDKNIELRSGDTLNIIISQTVSMGNNSRKSTWRIVDFK